MEFRSTKENKGKHEYRSQEYTIQKYSSTGVQEYRNTKIQEYRSTGVQEYRSTGVEGGGPEVQL